MLLRGSVARREEWASLLDIINYEAGGRSQGNGGGGGLNLYLRRGFGRQRLIFGNLLGLFGVLIIF